MKKLALLEASIVSGTKANPKKKRNPNLKT
jgi:hypothetical protein